MDAILLFNDSEEIIEIDVSAIVQGYILVPVSPSTDKLSLWTNGDLAINSNFETMLFSFSGHKNGMPVFKYKAKGTKGTKWTK